MAAVRSKDYINNKEFFNAILDWYASGKENPPDFLVKAIIQICERLGSKNNFRGYSWLDDMISAAKEVCYIALKNKKFNPERTQNPFAYFSMIAHNEFVKTINTEKKESYLKHKALSFHELELVLNSIPFEPSEMDGSGRIESLIEKFESKKTKKITPTQEEDNGQSTLSPS
jgi:hypothetical protein